MIDEEGYITVRLKARDYGGWLAAMQAWLKKPENQKRQTATGKAMSHKKNPAAALTIALRTMTKLTS